MRKTHASLNLVEVPGSVSMSSLISCKGALFMFIDRSQHHRIMTIDQRGVVGVRFWSSSIDRSFSTPIEGLHG
jgi:hypothetical protein